MQVSVEDENGIVFFFDTSSTSMQAPVLPFGQEQFLEVEKAIRAALGFLVGPKGDLTPAKMSEAGIVLEQG